MGGRGGKGIAGSPHSSRAFIAGNDLPQDQQIYFIVSSMIRHDTRPSLRAQELDYAILWGKMKESWFIVEGFPGPTADAVAINEPFGDTGGLALVEEDEGVPMAKDSLPHLMEIGDWRAFDHDLNAPIVWDDLTITQPDAHSLIVKNDSILWTLTIHEQIGAEPLLYAAEVAPGKTYTYQCPVAPELSRTPGFGLRFHFNNPMEARSLVYVRQK